jgi:hypothetical protein
MKSNFFVIGLTLFALQLSTAKADGVLALTAGTQTCEGRNVPQSAVATFPNTQYQLSTVGYGLRSKKVVIANVKVYCAEVLVSQPTQFVHSSANDAALKSLSTMDATAIRLDFVRGVDAQTVKSSFADAFNANHIDTSSPSVAAFLNAVAQGGDAAENKALTIAMDAKNGVVLYENSKGVVTQVQGDANTIAAIESIWFGVPADSGLANLKKLLIGE